MTPKTAETSPSAARPVEGEEPRNPRHQAGKRPGNKPGTLAEKNPARQIESLFAARGLRCTQQRKALYGALLASRSHPTADDLFQEVSGEVQGLSLATVYNTLEALCEAGLIQKLPGAGLNGSARYDVVSENHLHMRCQHTGTVDDVPEDISQQILNRIPPKLLKELESRLGFHISQVQIELVGEYAK